MNIQKKTQKNVEESTRRSSVASIHRAGTEIRRAELERLSLQATILKGMAKGYLDSLNDSNGMRSPVEDFFQMLDQDECEAIQGLISLPVSMQQHRGTMQQVENLLQAINRLKSQLETEGTFFDFPPFAMVLPTRDMAIIQLRSAVGFLDGIIRSSKKSR